MGRTALNVGIGILIGMVGVWVLLSLTTKLLEAWTRRLQRQTAELRAESEALDLVLLEETNERRAFMAAKLSSGQYSAPDDEGLIVYLREMELIEISINVPDKTIEAHFGGGWGYIVKDDETLMIPKRQDEDIKIEEMFGEFVLNCYWPNIPDDVFNLYTKGLKMWFEHDTPLMVCLVPGRPASVLEEADQTHWLPFPLG